MVTTETDRDTERPDLHAAKKSWYARKPFILFAAGFICALLAVAGFQLIQERLAPETKISCHQPTTQATQTPYCIYYKNHRLMIGADNDRGTVYVIPYKPQDISVSWDKNTDAATITMPGTKLIIQSGEYVNER